MVILASGVWQNEGLNGVTMTTTAFIAELGSFGSMAFIGCRSHIQYFHDDELFILWQ